MKKHSFKNILFFFFIIIFLLGVWGWMISKPVYGGEYTLLDAIYKTIKLLVVDEAGQVSNLQLEIARFTLPLFTITALIGVILKALGKQLIFIKLKLTPKKTIIFGLDNSALIAAASLQETSKLFVDLSDEGLDYSGKIAEKVPILVHLEQINDKELKSLNFSKAEEIYILLGDDERNIQLAQTLINLLDEKATPHLVINIDNQAILRIACREEIFIKYREKGGEINWFNKHRQATRTLLKEYPPLSIPSSQHTGDVHIGVVGLTIFSKQLILSLARNCVYLNDKKIIISVFSHNIREYQTFIDSNPALSTNSTTLGFGGCSLNLKINHYIVPQMTFLPSVAKQSIDDNGELAKIYVTDDTDYGVIELSQRVKQGLLVVETPFNIVACLPNTHFYCDDDVNYLRKNPTDNKKDKKEKNPLEGIEFFSILGTGTDTAGNRNCGEILAKIVHTAYKCSYDNTKFEHYYEIVEKEWTASLEEEFRQSSRYSADHFFIKLRELGYELYEKEKDTETTVNPHTLFHLQEDIRKHLAELNRMEHQRFCQERFIDGWRYAPKSNKVMHINATLIPFDPLSELEKLKDQLIIQSIIFYLENKKFNKHFGLRKIGNKQ